MTTHYLDHLAAFHAEAARVLAAGEIHGVPDCDFVKAREAEAFIETLAALAGCMDRLLMQVLGDADDHIGALSDQQRRDTFQIVTGAVEHEHDYPFQHFADQVWQGSPSPPIQGAMDARMTGVGVGRGR